MKLSLLLSCPISFVLFLLPTLIHAQNPLAANNFNFIGSTPTQRIYINQTQAQAVISAAAGKALGFSPSNIAVTDPSGLLVAFLRGDNAYPASIDISIKKARTVSLFNGGLTTAQLYNASVPGGALYGIEETNGGLVVFGGGLPIYVGGHFIGAVGVSGGTAQQDVDVATAGVQAVWSTKAS